MWKGLYPPQAIFNRRKFKKVLLNPPNFEPGSWCGAGKLWIDSENKEYWLTSRPRQGAELRGYAVEVYRSKDGENFKLASTISKEELTEMSGRTIQSIENQQLLLDPTTNQFFLYLSTDVAQENVAGIETRTYESRWETYLMSSDDPSGPWKGEGFVIKGDQEYDSAEARDATIDIIDGRYMALYRTRKIGTQNLQMALALSSDGKTWVKFGKLTVDGKTQPHDFLLNGSILAGCSGPIYVGTKSIDVVKGAHLTKRFAAYVLDYRNCNLETIFESPWIPGSEYEHEEYPIHTYSNVVYDPTKHQWLIWIEAVDPINSKEPGLNLEVDRVLLYITD